MELVDKKMKHRVRFCPVSFEEIRSIDAMVLANLRLSLNVFITGDLVLARQLLAQKVALRTVQQAATEQHLARCASGRADTIESSCLQLDFVRDLKRTNSHLSAITYPILEQTGELAEGRLRSVPPSLDRERLA